eukprot:gnl/TRDRNA2_/TRDRNA2_156142_c3_seq1.p1 gnl/TRDRNA2_/TRDRNA2_156142_c3~~gnl/TRDRNA2_/TRDRNA2_156142_c3_seq1.p1  ORF type:complete len:213 (+),score=44.27 gnl/TRDRNA2_/TRDRNA2_156142_c3_seq1:66-641(+)
MVTLDWGDYGLEGPRVLVDEDVWILVQVLKALYDDKVTPTIPLVRHCIKFVLKKFALRLDWSVAYLRGIVASMDQTGQQPKIVFQTGDGGEKEESLVFEPPPEGFAGFADEDTAASHIDEEAQDEARRLFEQHSWPVTRQGDCECFEVARWLQAKSEILTAKGFGRVLSIVRQTMESVRPSTGAVGTDRGA